MPGESSASILATRNSSECETDNQPAGLSIRHRKNDSARPVHFLVFSTNRLACRRGSGLYIAHLITIETRHTQFFSKSHSELLLHSAKRPVTARYSRFCGERIFWIPVAIALFMASSDGARGLPRPALRRSANRQGCLVWMEPIVHPSSSPIHSKLLPTLNSQSAGPRCC